VILIFIPFLEYLKKKTRKIKEKMNQVENFLNKINEIQNENKQTLSIYLLEQNGWNLIRDVYSKKIQVIIIIL
jgi:endo-alpha-1,4-polygalactosaminidase (GH114 family)